MDTDELDQLIAKVLASPKYREICPDLVRDIGRQEIPKRRNLKAAIKSTKSKLHQVAGAYVGSDLPYARWSRELRVAASTSEEAFREVCREIMNHHASTRERLVSLDVFYRTTLGGLDPIESVLDVACGLHPLAIPWMPISQGARYEAIDIYMDMMAFVGEFLDLAGVRGRALCSNILGSIPTDRFDLALILKGLPCLEQLERTAGSRLLDSIRARHLLISYPIHSLGGRGKGMSQHYERHFTQLIDGKTWQIRRFEFPTELAFLIRR